jgi:hypothetical protein
MHRSALLLILLSTGCAETAVPGPSFVPPAHHSGAWQQFCEQAVNVAQASALVGARGADGFELVAMYNGVLCYKRPAPDYTRPPAQSGPAPGLSGGNLVPVVRDPGF